MCEAIGAPVNQVAPEVLPQTWPATLEAGNQLNQVLPSSEERVRARRAHPLRGCSSSWRPGGRGGAAQRQQAGV